MDEALDLTFIAAADLSAKQYYFVKFNTTEGQVDVCSGTTDIAIGVLQNNPASGKAAIVRFFGRTKVSADAALTVGLVLGTSADGQAASYAAGSDTTKYLKGICTKAAPVAGNIAEMYLIPIARGA